MQPVDYWLNEYAKDHQHQANQILHSICVPIIVISLIGLLWSLPVPAEFTKISPALNWATAFLLASVVYYFVISVPLAFGMLPLVLMAVVIVNWLDRLPGPLWLLSAILFATGWVGQFIGHAAEKKRPSFFRDLQFLMIGPLWLLAKLFRKLGIPY